MSRVHPGLYLMTAACLVALVGCAGSRDAVDQQRAAASNASLGADYLRKNDNTKAQSRFQRALDYDSDNVTANWGMAIVSARMGESKRARRYYDKTLALAPGGRILNSYAVFLCQQGDAARARQYFQRAANDPSYTGAANALANAGLCAYRHGHTQAAERFYRQALAANADQVAALVHMARLTYDQSDYLRARAFIERAAAVTDLSAKQSLLGARIELALNDRKAAGAYLQRYNAARPSAALSLSQLEQSR